MPTPFLTHPFPVTVFALIFFPLLSLAGKTCSNYYCVSSNGTDGDADSRPQLLPIRFPFLAVASNQSARCGYPGFELSCNKQSQPLINLGSSGQFTVVQINYTKQVIWITDPNECLPKRILNLNLSGSPFTGFENCEFTFFNCSFSPNSSLPFGISEREKISCLSGQNYTVFYAAPSTFSYGYLSGSSKCRQIKQVSVPMCRWFEKPFDVLQLSWSAPQCGSCEARWGSCGFKGDSDLTVVCHVPRGGSGSGSGSVLPRGVEYGLILGVGIPGLVCVIGLILFISSKIIIYSQRHRRSNSEFSLSIFRQPAVIASGLDSATIESYPKTVLGESRRLPEPCNDGTCSICLSEYAPQETLRIIPECNHYFHAQCIDDWLREKPTCPLCRNSPEKPAAATASLTATSLATRSTPRNIDLEA
ncbi:hypothetical protein Ancab_032816 [Ancistrocladus abbreviatus]